MGLCFCYEATLLFTMSVFKVVDKKGNSIKSFCSGDALLRFELGSINL
jgi:hypothetical protein